MQDGDDSGLGLGTTLNNPSTEETDLTDAFWFLLPAVVFFALLAAALVFF